jgi:hypothetical protein
MCFGESVVSSHNTSLAIQCSHQQFVLWLWVQQWVQFTLHFIGNLLVTNTSQLLLTGFDSTDNDEAYIVLFVQYHCFCFVLYFSVYEKHCTIHFISAHRFKVCRSESMGVLSFTVLLTHVRFKMWKVVHVGWQWKKWCTTFHRTRLSINFNLFMSFWLASFWWLNLRHVCVY